MRPELRPVTVTLIGLIGGEETSTFAGIGEAAWALHLCQDCRRRLEESYAAEIRWAAPDTECAGADGADPCWGWRVVDIEY